MKSYNEVAHDVFRRRDEYERTHHHKKAVYRRISVAIVTMLLFSVGTCYAIAASMGIIDDFLGIFSNRIDTPLTTDQQQFLEDAVAEIGERVSCNGYTVTVQGTFTDGTVELEMPLIGKLMQRWPRSRT